MCFILLQGSRLITSLAAPVPYVWDFTTPADYVVSDSASVEVNSNTARLKVQNYSVDANTKLLLHLDESTGNPIDSSGTPHSVTATDISYASGRLNNAAVFDGVGSQLTVPDSTGISLSTSHTIEAWVSLASAFSAHSSYTRQPIFDKGSHQLYFERDTGELVYELARADQTTWQHVAGPITSDTPGSEAESTSGVGGGTWDYDGKSAISSMIHIGSNMYVGTGAGLSDAEVWRWNGVSWTMIGGDGIRGSWVNQKYEIVSAMANDGNILYVGLGSTTLGNDGDAEVWSMDTSSDSNNWVKIGGDGVNGSWNYVLTTQGPFEIVNTLHFVAGALYAGLGNTSASTSNSDGEVWRFSSGTWTKVGGDSGQDGYGWTTAARQEEVVSLTSDGTYLYAGLGASAGDGDVWRATLESLAATPSWEKIGGDGTGWGASTFEKVSALYAQGGYIYAGLGTSAAGDGEVWRYNGSSWTKIGECPSTSNCTTQGWRNNLYEQIWSITGDGTNVYVSMGNTASDNDVWRFDDAGTEATADDVWTMIAGSTGATDIGNTHHIARVVYHDGTDLYVGLQQTSNTFPGEVWKWTGTQYIWTIIGGNFINDSWGFYPISRVETMLSTGDKLYVGLGATGNGRYGGGHVYEFDGVAWDRIGGMGKQNSWNGVFSPLANYESVPSLAEYEGKLYAGLGSSAGDGEVWGYGVVENDQWTRIGGDANTMVAVAESGTNNRIMSTGNGTTWTSRTNPDDNDWTGLVHANDQYVAVASSGTGNRVMTSPDGITWTIRTSAADNDWRSVTYGKGLFVAVASSGTGNRVMTSPDGITWTIRTSAADISWNSITYGNGVFVAVANDGVVESVMTSSDGLSWTIQSAANSNAWEAVSFGNNTFVAVASTGTNNRAMTSPDGATWTIRTTPSSNTNTWTAVAFHQSYNSNNGLFVAVADTGTTSRVMSSTNNGATWTLRATPFSNAWAAVATPTGWSSGAGIEVIASMSTYTCPNATTSCLYVGTGISANDGKVFVYDQSSWQQIAGNGTIGSWEGLGIESVNALTVYNSKLYAALGNTAPSASNGDAEIWEYTGNGTAWNKVAGDGINDSWNYSGAIAYGPYESINATAVYDGYFYVGLGNSADGSSFADSEVWRWDGLASWEKVGGDGLNGSWDDSQNFEAVRSMTVYNGELYVGLGDTAAVGLVDGEVWKWNGVTWTLIGGEDSVNSSWSDSVTPRKEQVYSLATFNGRLYAGLGNSVGDAAIWAYGRNQIVRTTSDVSHTTDWMHVAAVYDQSLGSDQLKLYINGVEKGVTSASVNTVDNSLPLLVGSEYGTRYQGDRHGYYTGRLDEIRFSNNVRTTFNLTPYSNQPHAVAPNVPQFTSGVKEWASFDTSGAVEGQGIRYRLSVDGGNTWKYWNTGSSAWATSTINFATDDEATILSRVNDKATIDANIASLVAGSGGISWQAILNGDGDTQVTLNSVTITAEPDTDSPSNPTVINALSASSGGIPIDSDTWYAHTNPHFTWSGADDGDGSGVAGYFVVFEQATKIAITPTPPSTEAFSYVCDDDPELHGMPQASPTYTASGLTSGEVYCLRIKTYDYAGNKSGVLSAFIYKFDNVNGVAPTLNPPAPAGYAPEDNYTFSWLPIALSANGAPIVKLQYKTGATVGGRGDAYADWQDLAPTLTSVYLTDASYQDEENIFYLRTVDAAGNASITASRSFYYAGDGASPPQALTVNNTTSTTCSFTFSWQAPETYLGSNASQLTYCYTVNIQPNANLCNGRFTANGITSASNYCDQNMRNGINTFYVVAKNPESQGGTVNYGAYSSTSFTLNTSSPGVPANVEVGDISVKSLEQWKLTVSWLKPTLNGDAVDSYEVWRSEDGITFEKIGETGKRGTAYVDADLEQKTYYYQVNACDVVKNCGPYSETVEKYPTGKFTEPANLVSGPASSDITTKKATITWGTDRVSDSKVQFGTEAGKYFTEEPSNSTQVTDHEIMLNNLSPGTTYYYKAKWTDEDGNTGISPEKSFTTEPAPTIKDVLATKVGIDNAFITFTVTGGSRVKLYYGDTASFGSIKTIYVGASETTESVELAELQDDTKYYYKVNGVDADGVEYDGTTLSFSTVPRPKVSGVRLQQIVGTAQPAVLVSWESNTSISSIVTYYPTRNPSDVRDEISVELTPGLHQMVLRGLLPDTEYALMVSGRDRTGNEARSERQTFTTATDTRPPRVTNLKIESSTTKVSAGSNDKLAQLVVSWTTDEPATSQVEYGEGTGATYPQKSQEDTQLKLNHLVIISNLPTSRVYHLRALSTDFAGNVGPSQDTVTITPKGSDDALDLVMRNLVESFGFLREVLPSR